MTMRVRMRGTLAVVMGATIIVLAGACAGGDSQAEPTDTDPATSTADPNPTPGAMATVVRTATATPPANPVPTTIPTAIPVVTPALSPRLFSEATTVGSDVGTFEELLKFVPDLPVYRLMVQLNNYAAIRSAYGIDVPGPDADTQAVGEYRATIKQGYGRITSPLGFGPIMDPTNVNLAIEYYAGESSAYVVAGVDGVPQGPG